MKLVSTLAVIAIPVFACGGSVIGGESPDASDDSGRSQPPDGVARGDAGVSGDAGAESSPRGDAAPVDPLAPCAVDRDVFYYDVEAYPGPFELGEQSFTNHNSKWWTQLSNGLDVTVSTGSSAGGGIAVYTPDGKPPRPGTYAQGRGIQNNPASFSVTIGDEICGVESGTFTLVDIKTQPTDASGSILTSLLAWFDVKCGWQPSAIPVRGCMRYEVSP